MSKKCEIKTCGDCPHFDNHYYDYVATCTKLDRRISSDKDTFEFIMPDDCPLDDWDNTKKGVDHE